MSRTTSARPWSRSARAAGRDADDQPGRADQRQPELAQGGRARPVAARRLHPAREDHPLRPRAHPRARRARARRRRPRLLPGLRVAGRATRRPGSCRTRPSKTPVFVRFSTVAGSRGSTDLARDVRGFAVKFYTEEGNFDLVGNNIPVFFIQDAIKFPDLVHAVKPEPHNEMPQAASAHDTFWDFISLMPESMHMIMWVMSDRAIPRSFRMMEGFGVHTFRLHQRAGRVALREVSLEAAARRALGRLGRGAEDLRQGPRLPPPRSVGSDRERRLSRVGARRADRRGEGRAQVRLRPARPDQDHPGRARAGAAHRQADARTATRTTSSPRPSRSPSTPATSCPGIDFTNDPLLQGRLFSYTDTQLIRLGGPNFHEIPINRPVAPVHNNQRDGYMRQTINTGPRELRAELDRRRLPVPGRRAAWAASPASRSGSTRRRSARGARSSSTTSARRRCSGTASRSRRRTTSSRRSASSSARSRPPPIRERMVGMLAQVDRGLAERVAEGLGLPAIPKLEPPLNRSIPADGNPEDFQPRRAKATPHSRRSPALSMANTVKDTAKTRKVAILAADGVDAAAVEAMKKALTAAGAVAEGRRAARRHADRQRDGARSPVDFSLLTVGSVLFDAVYVPGGAESVEGAQGRRHGRALRQRGLQALQGARGDGRGHRAASQPQRCDARPGDGRGESRKASSAAATATSPEWRRS